MISAYNPQVYQEKPIKYNYNVEGVQRLLQLKNSLYEHNYEYIQGLKSNTLGVQFLNEDGRKEIKNIQDNVNNFFKTHDINKYDVGDTAIANEFTNQFKSLEANRPLQELYRIDKSLQKDLSTVNNLRLDKDRDKKGYSTGNHELFQYKLEEYAKLDKATAVAKGADAFRYTPYTNPLPEIKSLISLIPISKYQVIGKDGIIHDVQGRDPLDVTKTLNEGLSEGVKKQMAVNGELEVRRALRNGLSIEDIYKTAILPRTSPILMDKTKKLQALNIELNAAILGGDPSKKALAEDKINQVKSEIENIKNKTDMSVISKMSKDQFIDTYGQVSVDHQLEHLGHSFGKLNETVNMAHYAIEVRKQQFKDKMNFDLSTHRDNMSIEQMKLRMDAEKNSKSDSNSNNTGTSGAIPSIENATNDLTYQAFDNFHTKVNENAAEIYKDPNILNKLVEDGNLQNNPNIYAKAFKIFLGSNQVLNANLDKTQKVQVFQSLINDIKSGNYSGSTDLKTRMYKELKSSYDYNNVYNKQWNNSVMDINRSIGLNDGRFLTEQEYKSQIKSRGLTGDYNDYKLSINRATQSKLSTNYTVLSLKAENSDLLSKDLDKDQRAAIADYFNKSLNEVENLILPDKVADGKVSSDATQITHLKGSGIVKSVTKTPSGYIVNFVDNKTEYKGDGEDEAVKSISKTKNKFIALKDGKILPIGEGPIFIPAQNESPGKHLQNLAIMNSTSYDPITYNYKGYTMWMYNDNGPKFRTNIPDYTNPSNFIDLSTRLATVENPIDAFEGFVNKITNNATTR